MKYIFVCLSNLWILLLLKWSWRNEKSMAGNSIKARGVKILGSNWLSSSQGWGWRAKGVVFPHHPCGVHEICSLTLHLTPYGITLGDDKSLVTVIFLFKILQFWHGTRVGWEGGEGGERERDHRGWKEVMNFKQTTGRQKDWTPQKSFNTSKTSKLGKPH